MAIASLDDLLTHELIHVADAERRIAEALDAQIDAVDDPDVEDLLEARLESGERLKAVVVDALKRRGGTPGSSGGDAARAIISAIEADMGEAQTPELRMAMLIAGVRKIEHHCLATWDAVRAYAGEAGEADLADAMQRAIDEARDRDDQLSDIADQGVHAGAAKTEASEAEDASKGLSEDETVRDS